MKYLYLPLYNDVRKSLLLLKFKRNPNSWARRYAIQCTFATQVYNPYKLTTRISISRALRIQYFYPHSLAVPRLSSFHSLRRVTKIPENSRRSNLPFAKTPRKRARERERERDAASIERHFQYKEKAFPKAYRHHLNCICKASTNCYTVLSSPRCTRPAFLPAKRKLAHVPRANLTYVFHVTMPLRSWRIREAARVNIAPRRASQSGLVRYEILIIAFSNASNSSGICLYPESDAQPRDAT